MFKDLKYKNVVLTGGSGFIGKQITKGFVDNKSKVIILDLVKPKFKNYSKFYKCDITNEKEVLNVMKEIKKKFSVDILINNAANDYLPKKSKNTFFENFSFQNWEKDLKVGLTGAFICTKIFGGEMAKSRDGVILNISSDLGLIAPNQEIYKKTGFRKPVSYSVIKHGVIGLTKYTASYWADKNVRCNALAPGGIENNQDKIFLKKIKSLIPMKRMARINEYNNIIMFLCSKSSSYMTGSVVVADGGRTVI